MIEQELFGGNMKMLLPSGGQDVSDMRQVPDNQEVFVHNSTDQSIMIELLTLVQETDEQALRTHFEDLAASNDAIGPDNSKIISIGSLPTNLLSLSQCTSAHYVVGEQMVSKFNETARNAITVHMALLRLTQHDTDVIVTFNDPMYISAQSSSNVPGAEVVYLAPAGDVMAGLKGQQWTCDQFRQSVLSLRLINPEFLN